MLSPVPFLGDVPEPASLPLCTFSRVMREKELKMLSML